MKDKNTEKKDCIILDFDNTLYYNPNEGYSINIKPHNIIDAKQFFFHVVSKTNIKFSENTDLILITGRSQHQETFIVEILKTKGYFFSGVYFRTLDTSLIPMNEVEFLKWYRESKLDLMMKINQRKQYDGVYIFEDDEQMCRLLSQLDFHVYQVHLYSPLFRNAIDIIPHSFFTELNIKLQDRGEHIWQIL